MQAETCSTVLVVVLMLDKQINFQYMYVTKTKQLNNLQLMSNLKLGWETYLRAIHKQSDFSLPRLETSFCPRILFAKRKHPLYRSLCMPGS